MEACWGTPRREVSGRRAARRRVSGRRGTIPALLPSRQIHNLSGGYVIPFEKLFGTLAKGMSRTIVGRGVNNSHCTPGQTISRLKGGQVSESPDRTHSRCPTPSLTESRRSSWCRNWAISSTDVPSMPCSWRNWIPLLGFLLNLFQENVAHGLLISKLKGQK